MKIAYIFYDRPNYTAGPKINALRVLPELARRGHDVTALVLYHESFPSGPELQQQGVKVLATEWATCVEDQVAWLAPQLQAVNPDVFVPNISVSGCYAARYLRDAGRPTIAGHLSHDDFNWGMATRFCKTSDAWAVSGLFCMGHELGDEVRGWQPTRTRVVDIPHGVPINSDVADQSGPLRLVYAGRFEQRQKRVLDVTQAFADVLQRHSTTTACMIGNGSKQPEVQKIIDSLNMTGRIEVTGYVPPQEVQRTMLQNNVFVLLSDYEGVPGAVMDAMACGLVPVCLDIPGGLRELVIHEETGLLVKDRDADFQAAIERLNRDEPLRIRLAQNARRHIEQSFSLQVTVDRWEQLFAELLKTAGRRSPIRFPRKIKLPSPTQAFGAEDLRQPGLWQRVVRASHTRINNLANRFTRSAPALPKDATSDH